MLGRLLTDVLVQIENLVMAPSDQTTETGLAAFERRLAERQAAAGATPVSSLAARARAELERRPYDDRRG